MKKALAIIILISTFISCEKPKCECDLQFDELEEINSKLSAIKSFHNYEQIENEDKSIIREYNLELSNPFLSHTKTYKIVGKLQSPYIETILSKKFIEKKRTKYKTIKSNKINITNKEWTKIDDLINHGCFWTKQVTQETNIPDSVLFYSLEGIDLKRNICTNNIYHQIIRSSPNNEDIKSVIDEVLKFENTDDLDSLITIDLQKLKAK